MLLEFYKQRRTNFPRQYTFIAGSGKCILLQYRKPCEVDDEIAYKILGKDGDIVRQADEAPKVKKSKKKKVVESYTTA